MDILKYFTKNIREVLIKNVPLELYSSIEEIRLRNTKRIYIKSTFKQLMIDYVVTSEDLLESIELISENSIYTYQNQICNGYITVRGGHRIGISGNVSFENNKVLNINYIYSLNFRIAREIRGCSNHIIENIYDYKNNEVYNTLIVGRPATRKNHFIKRFSKKYK